jgi:hypothetical protein
VNNVVDIAVGRRVAWAREPSVGGAEWADVDLHADSLSARGVAIGANPLPYRLDYALQTGADFVTARLTVETQGQGWRRQLVLARSGGGDWSAETEMDGDADLPYPGGALATVSGALDCDLGLSPLTNSMPVLRHNLLEGGGSIDFLMAWVSVPDLAVRASAQRYTFIERLADRSIVRYESGSFRSDLSFDADGLVIDYPRLARRL